MVEISSEAGVSGAAVLAIFASFVVAFEPVLACLVDVVGVDLVAIDECYLLAHHVSLIF